MGAGAGDQDASGAEQAQASEVDFFVAGGGGVHRFTRLGEGRRIEDNQVEMAALGGVAGKQVEDVGFVEIDVGDAVGVGVGPGCGDGGCGTVHRFHRFAFGGEVKGEGSGGGETVEGFTASGVAGGGSVVFALVEEDSGFLAVEEIGSEGEAI